MSDFKIRAAKRENVWLLLGLAGGTGSGKTYTAMRLAKGLTGGEPFGVVDTENGRAEHYADNFAFQVVPFSAPFTPERYIDAIQVCVDAGHKVIVVDSMSHEWEGDGGMLDWHEREMGGKETKNLSAWIKPKGAHRKFVTYLLQVQAHVILCFRAAEKVEAVRNPETKRMEIVPKRSLTGLGGWVPISEKNLPYELTVSLLLTADKPGVPKAIKLQAQHKSMVPLDQQLTEQTGTALREWAAGPQAQETPKSPDTYTEDFESEADGLCDRLLLLASDKDRALQAINAKRGELAPGLFLDWLTDQIAKRTVAA
jgi:hypothetical protein